ncbi:MAG: cytochrome c [Sulfuricellaceae bacterium]|nr:cytochrome c [Sulfuricellaceae bacterium]
MNIKPVALLFTVTLSACGQPSGDAQNENPRHYDPLRLAQGERTFHTHCSTCHGWNGEGQAGWQKPGPNGALLPPPLDNNGRTARLNSKQIMAFIRQGSPDGRGAMPAWENKLSMREIDDLTLWITSLWSDRIYLEWQTKIEQDAR